MAEIEITHQSNKEEAKWAVSQCHDSFKGFLSDLSEIETEEELSRVLDKWEIQITDSIVSLSQLYDNWEYVIGELED